MQCDDCIYSTDDNVCACEDVIFNIDDECLSKIDIETYNRIYNKAIDDFAEKLNAKCDGMIKDKWNSNVAPISWAEAYADFKDDIDELSEQLKEGR